MKCRRTGSDSVDAWRVPHERDAQVALCEQVTRAAERNGKTYLNLASVPGQETDYIRASAGQQFLFAASPGTYLVLDGFWLAMWPPVLFKRYHEELDASS